KSANNEMAGTSLGQFNIKMNTIAGGSPMILSSAYRFRILRSGQRANDHIKPVATIMPGTKPIKARAISPPVPVAVRLIEIMTTKNDSARIDSKNVPENRFNVDRLLPDRSGLWRRTVAAENVQINPASNGRNKNTFQTGLFRVAVKSLAMNAA